VLREGTAARPTAQQSVAWCWQGVVRGCSDQQIAQAVNPAPDQPRIKQLAMQES